MHSVVGVRSDCRPRENGDSRINFGYMTRVFRGSDDLVAAFNP